MSEAITTLNFRARLARYFATGNNTPPKVVYMDFGDGGHNANGSVKTADSSQTALSRRRIRKTLTSVVQEDDYSLTCTGKIAPGECVGYSISEAGLVDADGNLLGFRNFAPKVKEDDEEFEVKIRLRF